MAAIDDEADHLNMLVGNLLDMSRIESGALRASAPMEHALAEIVARPCWCACATVTESHRLDSWTSRRILPLVPVDYRRRWNRSLPTWSPTAQVRAGRTPSRNSGSEASSDYEVHVQVEQPGAAGARRTSGAHLRQVLSHHRRGPGDRDGVWGFPSAKASSRHTEGASGQRTCRGGWPSTSRCH